MPAAYNSFVIRWWTFSGGQHRLEVEHVQSHARLRMASIQAAVEWMVTHCDQLTPAAPPTSVAEPHRPPPVRQAPGEDER